MLALNIDQGKTADQCYRVYQAAFARIPDSAGVAYHINGRGASTEEIAYYQDHFDKGIWSRPQVMINFAESPENINLVSSQMENGIFLESFL